MKAESSTKKQQSSQVLSALHEDTQNTFWVIHDPAQPYLTQTEVAKVLRTSLQRKLNAYVVISHSSRMVLNSLIVWSWC